MRITVKVRHENRGLGVGTRVRRNQETWPYANEDCDADGKETAGTVTRLEKGSSMYEYLVKWDNGSEWWYDRRSLKSIEK